MKDHDLERLLIKTLQPRDTIATLLVRLRKLGGQPIREAAVRQMVWRLIDRGQLRLTADRKLEAAAYPKCPDCGGEQPT